MCGRDVLLLLILKLVLVVDTEHTEPNEQWQAACFLFPLCPLLFRFYSSSSSSSSLLEQNILRALCGHYSPTHSAYLHCILVLLSPLLSLSFFSPLSAAMPPLSVVVLLLLYDPLPFSLSLILAVPGTLVPLVHCRCCCCCLVSRALAVLQTTAVVSAGWLAGKAKAWSSFSPSSSSPQTHSLPKLTHSQGTELYWIEPSRTQTDQTRRRAFCSGVCVLSLLKS